MKTKSEIIEDMAKNIALSWYNRKEWSENTFAVFDNATDYVRVMWYLWIPEAKAALESLPVIFLEQSTQPILNDRIAEIDGLGPQSYTVVDDKSYNEWDRSYYGEPDGFISITEAKDLILNHEYSVIQRNGLPVITVKKE